MVRNPVNKMTKNNRLALLLLLCSLTLLSCTKNRTLFLEDSVTDGLSVFSDQGHNVMSCYINGEAHRTEDRMIYTGLFGRSQYEIHIFKGISDTAETLSFSWREIELVLQKEKFTFDDFRELQGQRIRIDGTNGYFQIKSERGTGTVYFHKAALIKSSFIGKIGDISGIFEFSTPSNVVTHGRFDHSLDSENVSFN